MGVKVGVKGHEERPIYKRWKVGSLVRYFLRRPRLRKRQVSFSRMSSYHGGGAQWALICLRASGELVQSAAMAVARRVDGHGDLVTVLR